MKTYKTEKRIKLRRPTFDNCVAKLETEIARLKSWKKRWLTARSEKTIEKLRAEYHRSVTTVARCSERLTHSNSIWFVDEIR
jgi:hypothetical protein